MQKLFRILANKNNNFSFEGNVCNCERLKPSNTYMYTHIVTRICILSGKIVTDQQWNEFDRMSETHLVSA